MRRTPLLILLALSWPVASGFGWDIESLSEEVQATLLEGKPALLSRRPDESGEIDKRFVTMAMLMKGTRAEIWEVIHDKEDAEVFLDGVLESEVIEEGENEMIVKQRTRVGGPKGSYVYTLRHKLTPMEQTDFTYEGGELRDVIGTWWIYEGPDGESGEAHLVVYSLHIDPGIFAPQIVVRRGMKKTIPATLTSIQKEVLRRRAKGGE
jgi:hypothetical protein